MAKIPQFPQVTDAPLTQADAESLVRAAATAARIAKDTGDATMWDALFGSFSDPEQIEALALRAWDQIYQCGGPLIDTPAGTYDHPKDGQS
jgi:hypothetical protein